ncbi:MAG: hypothetical protein V9E99_10765 [Microthrixaceae bacterium]
MSPIIDGPHESMLPTSATKSSVPGCSSTGLPASHVTKRRSPHGRGAVLAALSGPNDERWPTVVATKASGARS